MARRVGAANVIANTARQALAEQLRQSMARYDVAEFQAQRHAATMVDVLAGFAMDPTLSVDFRRSCAKDVIERASGLPAQNLAPQLLDPSAAAPEGGTIGGTIDAIRLNTDKLAELDEWMSRPMAEWPERVKLLALEHALPYSEEPGPAG